jgi:hypothetical protein
MGSSYHAAFLLLWDLLPCLSDWLARAANIRPERLVIMVEEFCQLFRGYFLDPHQIHPFSIRQPCTCTELAPIGEWPAFKPLLTQRASLVFSAPAVQLSCLRPSRVADGPNNRSNEACTPCIVPPGIAHKMRYLPCTPPSLSLSRTFSLQSRIPAPETLPGISPDHWIRQSVSFE